MIYGLATVLPRMFSFILVPLYTDLLPKAEYGQITVIFAYMIFFNVILAYGMETSFFRFYNKEDDKKKVIETSMVTIFWTTILFLAGALTFRNDIAKFIEIDVQYFTYSIWILVLDALVIIPFSKLRAIQRPRFYAFLKISNVVVNLSLNVFFLVYLPKIVASQPSGFLSSIYFENFQIGYVFISNVIASLLTFVLLSKDYFTLNWKFDVKLWKQMMKTSLFKICMIILI